MNDRVLYFRSMSTVAQGRCVGCGAAVTGRYCADCGEHTEPHDYSMAHFILFFTTFYTT